MRNIRRYKKKLFLNKGMDKQKTTKKVREIIKQKMIRILKNLKIWNKWQKMNYYQTKIVIKMSNNM